MFTSKITNMFVALARTWLWLGQKVTNMFRALARTWLGRIAVALLIVPIGGCIWTFSAGYTALGAVTLVASVAYFLALIHISTSHWYWGIS
jgi:hypothetical protein